MYNNFPRGEFAPLNFWAGVATFGVGAAMDLFGGGGTDKGQMALGGPRCGTYPHSPAEVLAAYHRAPQNIRDRITEAVTEKSFVAEVIRTDEDLINCGLFLAEGGSDCQRGPSETTIKASFDYLMQNYGQVLQTTGFATTLAGVGVEDDPVVYTPDPGADPMGGFGAAVGEQAEEIYGGVVDTLQQVILGGATGAAQVAGGAEAAAQAEQERIAAGGIFGMDSTTVLLGGLAVVAVIFAVAR